MSRVRKLPSLTERCETGSIQFGEDWPGFFMRGDNAGAFVLYWEQIKNAIEEGRKIEPMGLAFFDSMVQSFNEANVHYARDNAFPGDKED